MKITQTVRSQYRQLPRTIRAIFITILMLAAYAATGFWLLPLWIKHALPDYSLSILERDARIEKILFNPFTFTLTIDGLSLSHNSSKLFSIEHLYTNIDPADFFSRNAVVISTLEINSLDANIERHADGRFNFIEIIERLSQDADNNIAQNSHSKKSTRNLIIDNLSLTKLAIHYREHLEHNGKMQTFRYNIGGTISGNNINTASNHKGQFKSSLTLNNSGNLMTNGELQFQPFTVSGVIHLDKLQLQDGFSYIANQFRFQLTNGLLKATLPFRLDNNALQLNEAAIDIKNLRLSDPEKNNTDIINLPALSTRGISLDSKLTSIRIKTLDATQGKLAATLSANRDIDLIKLLQPIASDEKKNTAPWKISLKTLSLKDWTLHLTDQQPEKPVTFTFSPLNLDISEFSTATQSLTIAMNTQLETGGQIFIKGPITLSPLASQLDIAINTLNLLPSQTYWQNIIYIDLLNGSVSGTATLDVKQTDKNTPVFTLLGNASIDDVKTRDRPGKQPLVNWKKTRLEKIRFSNNSPLSAAELSIKSVISDGFYARLIINKDKSINIQNLFTPSKETQSLTPIQKSTKQERVERIDLSINDIELANSRVDFSDYAIIPNFIAGIQKLKGHISGIGNNKKSQANIDFKGRINAYAPVTIIGQFNADNFTKFADIAINFRNIDMTTFTPYSGTFAGYKIEKGKLSVDLHYIIDNRKLTAKNGIFMDQLTLGEPVKSASATTLPVKLAVGLLKNDKGEIDIDLPISGDIDNPSFNVKHLLMKAVVNLVTQTISAPFTILAGLVGGGSELNSIAFPAGLATLDAKELEKLKKLGESLQQRPELYLEIARTVHPERDILALRGIQKFTVDTENPTATAENTINITPAEEDILRDLAIDRAQLIRSTLEHHGVKPRRLYITDRIEKTTDVDNGMIDVELKINSK